MFSIAGRMRTSNSADITSSKCASINVTISGRRHIQAQRHIVCMHVYYYLMWCRLLSSLSCCAYEMMGVLMCIVQYEKDFVCREIWTLQVWQLASWQWTEVNILSYLPVTSCLCFSLSCYRNCTAENSVIVYSFYLPWQLFALTSTNVLWIRN